MKVLILCVMAIVMSACASAKKDMVDCVQGYKDFQGHSHFQCDEP